MVSLKKGGAVSLSKNLFLKEITIGLGWTSRENMDLDASAFLLNKLGKTSCDNDFIFYNNLESNCGSIYHTGDDLEGGSGGDDEQLIVKLDKVPQRIETIVFVVTIHDPTNTRNFGRVSKAFIRIEDNITGNEIARYDLGEDFSSEDSVIFGELTRDNEANWIFKAVGNGFRGGLLEACNIYGINATN